MASTEQTIESALRLVEEENREKEVALERLAELERELDYLKEMNEALFIKERQSNIELQEAREEMIKGLLYVFSRHEKIGIKMMGDLDTKPFLDACNKKFDDSMEAETKAVELVCSCVDKLQNPHWHPVKVVAVDGAHKEVINEDDDLLKTLKAEWGVGICDAVVAAYMEMNESNPSGRYITNELWNFEDNRKATSKEVISYILKYIKRTKRGII